MSSTTKHWLRSCISCARCSFFCVGFVSMWSFTYSNKSNQCSWKPSKVLQSSCMLQLQTWEGLPWLNYSPWGISNAHPMHQLKEPIWQTTKQTSIAQNMKQHHDHRSSERNALFSFCILIRHRGITSLFVCSKETPCAGMCTLRKGITQPGMPNLCISMERKMLRMPF